MSSLTSSKQTNSKELTAEMKTLESSITHVDVATLAYIWGCPLITNIRTIDYSPDPQQYNESEAYEPWNKFQYMVVLANASFTQLVTLNVDTLYGSVYYDLEEQPLVISIPEGTDRYYVLQLIDAYTKQLSLS